MNIFSSSLDRVEALIGPTLFQSPQVFVDRLILHQNVCNFGHLFIRRISLKHIILIFKELQCNSDYYWLSRGSFCVESRGWAFSNYTCKVHDYSQVYSVIAGVTLHLVVHKLIQISDFLMKRHSFNFLGLRTWIVNLFINCKEQCHYHCHQVYRR